MFLEDKKSGEVKQPETGFKTAQELEITQGQYDTLVEVMGLLEDESIPEHSFNMRQVGLSSTAIALGCEIRKISSLPRSKTFHCGTPRCILGWCFTIGKAEEWWNINNNNLSKLFYPHHSNKAWIASRLEAVQAIRTYLTTGHDGWENK